MATLYILFASLKSPNLKRLLCFFQINIRPELVIWPEIALGWPWTTVLKVVFREFFLGHLISCLYQVDQQEYVELLDYLRSVFLQDMIFALPICFCSIAKIKIVLWNSKLVSWLKLTVASPKVMPNENVIWATRAQSLTDQGQTTAQPVVQASETTSTEQ